MIGAAGPPGRITRRSRRRRNPTRRRARVCTDADDHPGRARRRIGRVATATERTRRCGAQRAQRTHRRPLDHHLQFDPAEDAIVQAQWERVSGQEIRTGFLLAVRAIEEGRAGREPRSLGRARAESVEERADRDSRPLRAVNAVAPLALAGEVDEALAGLARVIEAGRRRGDSARRADPPALERSGALRSRRTAARGRSARDRGANAVLGARAAERLPRRLPRARPARARQDQRGGANPRCRSRRRAPAGPPDSATSRKRPRAARDRRAGTSPGRLHRGGRGGRVRLHPQSRIHPVAITGGARAASARTQRRGPSARGRGAGAVASLGRAAHGRRVVTCARSRRRRRSRRGAAARGS